MNLFTFFNAADLAELDETPEVTVIFDVLGSGTALVSAFAFGAVRAVIAKSAASALAEAETRDRDKILLVGSEKGHLIAGFDFPGLSHDYAAEIAAGRELIYYSKNLYEALMVCRRSPRVLLAGFNNLQAVVESVEQVETIHVLCAGRGKIFSFEDAVAAGLFGERLLSAYPGNLRLNDASVTSRYLYERHRHDLTGMILKPTAAEKSVSEQIRIGLANAARLDIINIAPELSLDKSCFLPVVVSEQLS